MLYNVAVLIKARLSFANSVESSGNHVWVLAKYLLRQPGVHQASEASERDVMHSIDGKIQMYCFWTFDKAGKI